MQKSSQDVPLPARLRCAIYTRKSTEEGLEQEFNSLDAQREAAEAFILSQRREGWIALPDLYDDGGFTGANMDRPALTRLLGAVAGIVLRRDEGDWLLPTRAVLLATGGVGALWRSTTNPGAAPWNVTVAGWPPTVTLTLCTSVFSTEPLTDPVTPAGLVAPPPVQ